MSAPRWIIAGGGTGGHLYPGLAIATSLRRQHPDSSIWFVGTRAGLEARVAPEAGFDVKFLDVQGIKNRGVGAYFKAMYTIPHAILQSRRIIKETAPTAVLGVGGYASGPLVLAAKLSGVPSAIQEQNAYPGITNRVLSKLVKRVYTSLPDTKGFPFQKVKEMGNPIRAEIQPRLEPARFTILVFGGSQGARTINRAMAEAAPLLAGWPEKPLIIHQTGKDTAVDVAAAYREAGIEADVRNYFDDMPSRYAKATVAVCRAGATSIAELAVAGVPAVLFPFPFAADNHQEKNADVLVNRGAAVKLLDKEATGEAITELLRSLADSTDKRRSMQAAMISLGRPNAADALVRDWLAETERS